MPKYGIVKYGVVKYGSEYLTAIAANARTTRISGKITLADSTELAITSGLVQSGSLYVSEQCVTGENLEIGNVFASELGVGILNSIGNYDFADAIIELNFDLLVGAAYESIPLGVFNVVEAPRNTISIMLIALDNMILLDAPIGATDVTAETPEGLVTNACATAGVTLATTHAMFETFPNKALPMTLPANSAVRTCRDLIMWACQANSTFARFNRAGVLEILSLHSTSVRSIASTERYSPTVVSDFAIKITGLNMKLGETVHSVGAADATMALQGNPLFELLDAAVVNSALGAILADITQAEYTPFDISFIGDPTLHAGDYVTLNDTAKVVDPIGLITHTTWRYRGKHSLRSVGKPGLVSTHIDQNKKKLISLDADIAHIIDLIVTGTITVSGDTTFDPSTVIDGGLISTGTLIVGGVGHMGAISVLNSTGEQIATIDHNGINVNALVGATGFTGNNGMAAVTMEFIDAYAQMQLSDLYEDFYEPILFKAQHIRASYDTLGTTYWSTDASYLDIGNSLGGGILGVHILDVIFMSNTGVSVNVSGTEIMTLTDTGASFFGVPVVTSWAVAAWAPTLYGITIGNGTVVARSKQLGVLSYFEFTLTFGSTTSVTGNVAFTIPSTAKTAHTIYGIIIDAGGTYYMVMGFLNAASNICSLFAANTAGTYLTSTLLSSTVPMTWATDDIIRISGWYEH